MAGLIVTQRMRDKEKTNKAIGSVQMDPEDFLYLTIGPGGIEHWVEQEGLDTFRPLSQYNAWIKDGTITSMPSLDIDMKTGKVLEHEGRHRAYALLKEHERRMEVAIRLRDRGYLEYYRQPFLDDLTHPKQYAKFYLGVDDIPEVIYGQASSTRVRLNLRTFDWFYKGYNTSALARLRLTKDEQVLQVHARLNSEARR